MISQKTISNLETGRNTLQGAEFQTLTTLARALGWTLEEMQQQTGVNLGVPFQTQSLEVADGRFVYAVDTASASRPSVFTEPSSGERHFIHRDNDRPGARVFIARGDSMLPTISDGDFCYCDTHDRNLIGGRIYVFVVIGDGACIKRAKHTTRGWLLNSDNPSFESFSSDDIEIVGRVYHVVPRGKSV